MKDMMDNNDLQRIKHLVELYFEGATSLREEAEIREYFAGTPQEDIDTELERYREYFCYMEQESGRINELACFSPDVPERKNRRLLIINLTSIAAAVVILISIFATFFSADSEKIAPGSKEQMVRLVINGEEIDDDDRAIKIVDDKLAKVNSIFSRAGERAQESLQRGEIHMGSISRAGQAISESVSKVDRIMSAINVKE